MLSAKIVGLLASRRYQPDAEWEVNILPFGSIFWTDEMPAITDLFDRPDDMAVIQAMFGIRLKIWDGVALDAQDQQLWDSVKRQVPWALFERLILTDEQRLAREKAERQVEQEFESIGPEREGA
jgi:hypothetical protein